MVDVSTMFNDGYVRISTHELTIPSRVSFHRTFASNMSKHPRTALSRRRVSLGARVIVNASQLIAERSGITAAQGNPPFSLVDGGYGHRYLLVLAALIIIFLPRLFLFFFFCGV